jgi:hypothetical protein
VIAPKSVGPEAISSSYVAPIPRVKNDEQQPRIFNEIQNIPSIIF